MNKYAEHSKQTQARQQLFNRIHGQHHVKGCLRKKPFTSEAAAQQFAEKNHYHQQPYHCRFCLQWHLTTKKQGAA